MVLLFCGNCPLLMGRYNFFLFSSIFVQINYERYLSVGNLDGIINYCSLHFLSSELFVVEASATAATITQERCYMH